MSTNKVTFLSMSDIRGDMDLVARGLALAQRKDVRAEGVFFLGNFAGPLLSRGDYANLHNALKALQYEINEHKAKYREEGVNSVRDLVAFMMKNPSRYRRGVEQQALKSIRYLVGLRDHTGQLIEFGKAAKKGRQVYSQALKQFSKAKIPVHLMADTVLAEEIIPEKYWLHFSWVSLSGFSFRCLGPSEIEDEDSIPEYFLGGRRGGIPIRLDNYPLTGADIIFAYVINPVLHEVLSSTQQKLVIISGKGNIDTGYSHNIVSTQKPSAAYLYTVDGMRMHRDRYVERNGKYERELSDTGAMETSTKFRRKELESAEMETKMRLAGLGMDLKVLMDYIQRENPDLARQIESAENRAESILRYVQYLEESRQEFKSILSAERAAMERLLNKIAGYFPEANSAKIYDKLAKLPEIKEGVEAIDQAHEEIAEMIGLFLAQKIGQVAASRRIAEADTSS